MKSIAEFGARVRVTPGDEIWIKTNEEDGIYLDDRTSFVFEVTEHLYDGQIFYGVAGPVLAGHARYLGLICNIFVRMDGSDWRVERVSGANFKVGSSLALRNHAFDFRHPEGTFLSGYPTIARYGHIEVVDLQ